jgi:hypothetical protein
MYKRTTKKKLSTLQKVLIGVLLLMLLSRAWVIAAAKGVLPAIPDPILPVVSFMSDWLTIAALFVAAIFCFMFIPALGIAVLLVAIAATVYQLGGWSLRGSNMQDNNGIPK